MRKIFTKKKWLIIGGVLVIFLFFIITQPAGNDFPDIPAEVSNAFGSEEKVEIVGYERNAMEPFLSRDGTILFFNSLNDAKDTNLHYATKISSNSFQYIGEVVGVNLEPPHLDAVASMDWNNKFYFISVRDYPSVFENVQSGIFSNGTVTGVRPLEGDFYVRIPGWIVMDAEINANGTQLYFVNAHLDNPPIPSESNIGVANLVNGKFIIDKSSKSIFQNINTDNPEYAPSISSDGLTLSFTRFAAGNTQILIAKRNALGGIFGTPEKIPIEGFAPEGATFAPGGKTIYYHKKDGKFYSIYKITR